MLRILQSCKLNQGLDIPFITRRLKSLLHKQNRPSPIKKSYQFRLYRNDLTAKALRTRSSRRESLIQDDEERILYHSHSMVPGGLEVMS